MNDENLPEIVNQKLLEIEADYENLLEIEEELKNFIAQNFPLQSYLELSEFADFFIDLFSRVEEMYNKNNDLFDHDFKIKHDYYKSFLEDYESDDYFERYKRTKRTHIKLEEDAEDAQDAEDAEDCWLPSDIKGELSRMRDWIDDFFESSLSLFEEKIEEKNDLES